jgi:hypothetical protein
VCVLTVCWAAKGGSGTTVVSCALALLSARHRPTWLVDLAGDVPAALGLAEASGPGVFDWITSVSASAATLESLAVPASDQLLVIPRGAAGASFDAARWALLGDYLAEMPTPVIVDAGTCGPPADLAGAARTRLLVTKPCYLALRRSIVGSAGSPTGIVLVTEPGRALRAQDVAAAIQVPVVAEVDLDPAIARAVDAGLLTSRLPHTLAESLRGLAA